MKASSAITSAVIVALAAASPTPVEKRADSCGDWDTIETGSYTLYNDLWGKASATSGSQCIGVDRLNGNSLSWHADWTWQGGQYSVKSYPNAVINSKGQQISAVTSIPSTWSWTYTGSSIVADVAYDIFTSSSAGGTQEFEIMIWLAALGGAGPISSNYGADGKAVPVGTATIAGHSWNLYKGPNGSTTVYSFIAASTVNDFNGDLKGFFDYLKTSQSYSESQYLLSIGAGSEPFTGTNAVLTVSDFSISINE